MSEATWGNTTAKATGGGSSDPNVISLKEANRIRLIEGGAVKWRQHFVESAKDPDQGRSVVCPKGPDGRSGQPCPLCMKPVGPDGKTQRFSISRRFATNVWDYDSNSVKILIAGPQVFEEFDAAAALGLDPTGSDYLIHKMGTGKQTAYKVIRGESGPLPVQITPDMLHDRTKYDTPTSTERIFEILEEMGIDYDALEMPSFTLEQAEGFVMPFGKHKGMTIEQLVANDEDYALFMHGKIEEGGGLGDPVFVALQTVLEDRGKVGPIDTMPSPAPRPATTPAQSAPATQPTTMPIPGTGTVTLIGPDGNPVDVPESVKDAMLAAGFTEPAPPPEPEPENVKLIGPDGAVVEVPASVVPSMLAAGFTNPQDTPQEPDEPEDTDEVVLDFSGTLATMSYGAAKPLIASGAAKLVQDKPQAAEPPAYQLPADDAMVQVKVGNVPVPIPMKWSDAKIAHRSGAAKIVDAELLAAFLADNDDDKAVAQTAASAPNPESPSVAPNSGDSGLDPALTAQRADGRWTHPAIAGKDYATKGAVTQALNRMKSAGTQQTAAASAPTAESNGQPATGKEAKLETAKNLLRGMPEIQSDFKALLGLFEEVAGKRQITDFTEPELDALIERLLKLQAEKTAA